jgi:hypothetical protein
VDEDCGGYEGLDDHRLSYDPAGARPGGWKCLRLVAVEVDPDPEWFFRRASATDPREWIRPLPRRQTWQCVHCGARLRYPLGDSVPRADAEPHIDGACLRRAFSAPSLVVAHRRR